LDTSEIRSEILGRFWNMVWRRRKKVSWTDRVKTEEILHRVKEGEEYPVYQK
jgi:hypothetical protein